MTNSDWWKNEITHARTLMNNAIWFKQWKTVVRVSAESATLDLTSQAVKYLFEQNIKSLDSIASLFQVVHKNWMVFLFNIIFYNHNQVAWKQMDCKDWYKPSAL